MADVELTWNGEKITNNVNLGTIKALIRSINVVDASAKLNTPVDTGLLRASNMKAVDTKTLIATEVNNTEYAPHIEFGTRYQKAQPFFRRALMDNKNIIEKIFIDEERKAIDK